MAFNLALIGWTWALMEQVPVNYVDQIFIYSCKWCIFDTSDWIDEIGAIVKSNSRIDPAGAG